LQSLTGVAHSNKKQRQEDDLVGSSQNANVGKVNHVDTQIGEGVADMVEIKVQVSGHEATDKTCRIQAWRHLSDWQLENRFERNRPVLLLPGSSWSSQHDPEFKFA